MNKLNSPNIYKGMTGLMDMSYAQMKELIEARGVYVGDASELCRAVRGFKGAKFDRIRKNIIVIFLEWLCDPRLPEDDKELLRRHTGGFKTLIDEIFTEVAE